MTAARSKRKPSTWQVSTQYNVKTGTPAAQIGLKKGDVIIGANQQAVKNIAELRKVLDSKPSVLALNIQRGDSTIYLLMQ